LVAISRSFEYRLEANPRQGAPAGQGVRFSACRHSYRHPERINLTPTAEGVTVEGSTVSRWRVRLTVSAAWHVT